MFTLQHAKIVAFEITSEVLKGRRNNFELFLRCSEVFGKSSEIFGSCLDVSGNSGHDRMKIQKMLACMCV